MKDIHSFEPLWENWAIDEKIGEGTYGVVWKAHREDRFTHVRQFAAVKHISIPKEEGTGEDDIPFGSEQSRQQYYRSMLDRLIVEIDAMVSLRGKPNIVTYEEHKIVPKDSGAGYDLFLRMELLTSLPKLLRDRGTPLERGEVLRLGIDIASALETLQGRSLVHRDIKPANIFVDAEGNYKLGDFGTARVLEVTGNASTKTGTPNYMAPEVFSRADHYDQTVDLYSLGIMLYRCLNDNYLPFMSAEAMDADTALLRRIKGDELPPPKNADPRLAAVVLKACAFRPGDRYQTAAEMKRDLLAVRAAAEKSQVPVFLYRPTDASLPAVETDVPVVCVREDGEELLRLTRRCRSDAANWVKAPDVKGYELLGEFRQKVIVEPDGLAEPETVVFRYRSRGEVTKKASVRVVCRDDRGHELQHYAVSVGEGRDSVVRAPGISGYSIAEQTPDTVEVRFGGDGAPSPDPVVFVYSPAAPARAAAGKKKLLPVLLAAAAVLLIGLGVLIAALTGGPGPQPASTPAPAETDAGGTPSSGEAEGQSTPSSGETDEPLAPTPAPTAVPTYTVTWLNWDGTVLETDERVEHGAYPRYDGATPVRATDAEHRYTFIGWTPGASAVTQDAVYTAVFKAQAFVTPTPAPTAVPVYTVTWLNWDGTVLETDERVEHGAYPRYDGATPVRATDAEHRYTFIGWTPGASAVTQDAVYTAVFKAQAFVTPTPEPTAVPVYTVTWLNWDGTVLETDERVEHGAYPRYDGAKPERATDAEHRYTFIGWTPGASAVTQDAVYTAVFKAQAFVTPTPATGEAWNCADCGALNHLPDLYCTNCGKGLCLECGGAVEPGDDFCTECGTRHGRWVCRKCGAENGADDNFCTECGTKRHAPGRK